MSKRKNRLIKDNIVGDVDPSCGRIKALKAFMQIAIPEEHTLFRAEFKLMSIVGSEVLPTSASEDT